MRRIGLAGLYAVASLALFAAWTLVARTEWLVPLKEGGPLERGWANLVDEIDGSAGVPFSRRRLLADPAAALARSVPASSWQAFAAFVEGPSVPGRALRRAFDFLQWGAEDYPVLVSAHFLLWLFSLGYLLTFRWLVVLCYETPAWLPHAAALVSGLTLLGGSDSNWASYPYDVPNAFVFGLALGAILGSRAWLLPAFALCCLSKETSLLLIPAYVVVQGARWRSWPFWATLVGMIALYVAIRQWVAWRFPGSGDEWWFPDRNFALLGRTAVYGLWWTLPGLVVVAGVVRRRKDLPRHLLLVLAGMACVLAGAAFFKGWMEERRAYLELMPLVGLIACRWVAVELGVPEWVRARVPPGGPARPASLPRV